MSTIHQLFEQGIRKIRLPIWNKFAYIELLEAEPGVCAPWCKLYDIGCPGRELPLSQIQSDEYEKWESLAGEYTEEYLRDVYNIPLGEHQKRGE
ncbi:MAG TPA: hypothetical protein VGN34_29170 [Ktedonobacteraceae bacterium]